MNAVNEHRMSLNRSVHSTSPFPGWSHSLSGDRTVVPVREHVMMGPREGRSALSIVPLFPGMILRCWRFCLTCLVGISTR